MNLSKERLNRLRESVIDGITNWDHPGAISPRTGRHFMDCWDWYQGVALFGLYQYAHQYSDQRIYDYLEDWFDRRLVAGLPEKNVNSMCPLLTLSFLYEEKPSDRYRALLDQWLQYAMEGMPRTMEQGFQHITIDSENYMQLWDDTLYMTVLFVARMGMLTGDDRYVQESVRQFIVHMKYLTEPVSGLLYHGWTFDGFHHFAGALWGRGNAWYTAGLVDYLDMTDVPQGVRDVLISSLSRQAEALLKYQDDEGMWHTLINEPETSYAEASATAGFSYGLLKACRLGYLDLKYVPAAKRALEAIAARVDENGILSQVSRGTRLLSTLDAYRNITTGAEPYGQAMALLLFVEADHWIGTV